MNALLVFIGGGLGSLMRYGISMISSKYIANGFPVATLISNIFACLILGIVMLIVIPKLPESTWIHPLVAVGICGGFSTFSTFSAETLNLFQSGNGILGLFNILTSVGTCIGILYMISSTAK